MARFIIQLGGPVTVPFSWAGRKWKDLSGREGRLLREVIALEAGLPIRHRRKIRSPALTLREAIAFEAGIPVCPGRNTRSAGFELPANLPSAQAESLCGNAA